jgi:4-amino-4-deoxy-L-arabinose transferase-like glycosyltransferase
MMAGVVAAVVPGIFLRFFVHSQLWLDEALSVDIARLPVRQIPGALRHDGAPPLYYVLLHFWMEVFGTGNIAVRGLSGVCSVATLPVMYLAGRRIASKRVGVAAVVITATSPFATHYATETRMYALLALLALLGYLALANAVQRPTRWSLVWVAVATAALLYTHYWSIYLLAAAGGWLVFRSWQTWRAGESLSARRRHLAPLGAMVVGGIAFLPWLPTFLFQAAHTGTPWAEPADFGALVDVVEELAGGGGEFARILAFVLFSLAILGLFGRGLDPRHVVLDLHTIPRARGLAAVLVGTPAIAIAVGIVTGTAFVARYTSVVFPLFCLLVALGVEAFTDHRTAAVMLAAASALGLWCSVGGALWSPRTQAGELASTLRAQAQPGDIVAFCPDQLGPSTVRLLPADLGVQTLTYPRSTPAGRVDWVDYGDAVKAASPATFAATLLGMAGPGHDVWLVESSGYRPFDDACTTIVDELTAARPEAYEAVETLPGRYFEHAALYRFAP